MEAIVVAIVVEATDGGGHVKGRNRSEGSNLLEIRSGAEWRRAGGRDGAMVREVKILSTAPFERRPCGIDAERRNREYYRIRMLVV